MEMSRQCGLARASLLSPSCMPVPPTPARCLEGTRRQAGDPLSSRAGPHLLGGSTDMVLPPGVLRFVAGMRGRQELWACLPDPFWLCDLERRTSHPCPSVSPLLGLTVGVQLSARLGAGSHEGSLAGVAVGGPHRLVPLPKGPPLPVHMPASDPRVPAISRFFGLKYFSKFCSAEPRSLRCS